MTMVSVVALAAAPVAVVVVLGLLRSPMRWALPAYAAVIPFSSLLSIGSSKFTSLSSLLGLALVLGLVLQLARVRSVRLRLSPTVPVWLLLLSVAGGTILWSLAPQVTATSVMILGSLVATYVFIALSPVDRDVLRRVENGLLLGGLAAIAFGLYQLLVQGGFPSDPPVPGSTDGRFGNGLLGPNNQAIAFILPLVVSLTRAVTRVGRRQRLGYAVVAALMLLGVLMTGSRGGILSTIVAVTVLLVAAPRGRLALTRYALTGVAVASYVFFLHPFGLAERTVETTSSSGRTDIWRVALAACPDYCPVGSGWGTFRLVYAETAASVPEARVLVGAGNYEPHNVWFLAAIELGVAGLLLLVLALGLTFREALRLPASLRGPPLSALAATVFAAFFLSNLEFKFFWMALIYVALNRNLVEGERTTSPPVEQRPRAPALRAGG